MFDMEQRIADWRTQISAALASEPAAVEELESHLRDEIEALVRKGNTPQAATDLAIARLGAPEALAGEFAKNARPWWPVYAWGAGLAAVLLLSLSWVPGMRGADDLLLGAHIASIMAGYVLCYGIGALAILYGIRRLVGDLPARQRTFWRKTVRYTSLAAFACTLLGVVLGSAWAARSWGVAFNGDLREIGGLIVTLWLIGIFLLSGRRDPRWLLCMGIAVNLAVTFAWFAPPLFAANQLHGYQSYWPVLGLALFLLAHLALMASALAPAGWLRRRKAA
jgi:hypothetical protein